MITQILAYLLIWLVIAALCRTLWRLGRIVIRAV